jgi:cyclopropane fatty-acyl-phospholipid synthase-like methyltransferase
MSSEFWNSRFSEPGYAYGTEPNVFLASQAHRLPRSGRALAVADGEGRNGVWLAQQGLDVLSVDVSEVGLQKTQALATSRGVSLKTELADLTVWNWPESEYDAVAAIFVHFGPEQRSRMHAAMFRALKPGGLLVMEAFNPLQLELKTGGPPVREMLYTVDMLRADFVQAGALEISETRTTLTEGLYHRGEAAVVRLILTRGV